MMGQTEEGGGRAGPGEGAQRKHVCLTSQPCASLQTHRATLGPWVRDLSE